MANAPGIAHVSTIASDRMRLRKLVLRMYWDGEKNPCVEVPLGDFFGSGLGTLRRFHSMAVDVNPGFSMLDFDGMVSYLPMPFAKGARITIENDGGVADLTFYYHIDYETLPAGAALPANSGHLHAQWRRDPHTSVAAGKPKNSQFGNMTAANTTGDDNFVVPDAAGHGNFVGLFLTIDNIAGGWYGEGVTSAPARRVDSWTAIDINIGYRANVGSGWLANTQVNLGINNALDERPPFVNQYEMPTGSVGSRTLGYDPANASLLGRQISLQAVKHWGQ